MKKKKHPKYFMTIENSYPEPQVWNNKTLKNLKFKEDHPKKGSKHDANYLEKPDLSLIPKDALWEMAKAFSYGANKYGRHNYREGIEISRLIAAAIRHITQYNEGEDLDPETRALHLGNGMAALAMAIYMHYNRPEMDDRYKGKKRKKK